MISMESIRQLSDQIVEEFHPQQIILFGSFSNGAQTPDSDVDLLVVMAYEGKSWKAATQIRQKVRPTFPVDLLVRSFAQFQKRIAMGDPFFNEIAQSRTVLYETNHG